MARNKYPEETVNLILDVSMKLFLEKGYDHTSIQDIINNLGGLSKGAIYHHFKSKESILYAVSKRMSEESYQEMDRIMNDASLNGLMKLQKMFLSSWKDMDHRRFIASMPNLIENPQLLAIHLDTTIHDVVPNYIQPVIELGIEDGSIKADNAKELANLLMLLSNIWLNPLIYPLSEENLSSKIKLFEQITDTLGLPIIHKDLEEHMIDVERRHEALS